MTNANEFIHYISCEADGNDNLGLTKREYFAAMAMQGMLSSSESLKGIDAEKYAAASIMCADALINELNKTK